MKSDEEKREGGTVTFRTVDHQGVQRTNRHGLENVDLSQCERGIRMGK
jgi:hypothetical protein